jgi:hypothetical protein
MNIVKPFFCILCILLCWVQQMEGQISNQPVSMTDKKGSNTKRFAIGYQLSYYYDDKLFVLFPIGVSLEYKLGKGNTSLDFQSIMYLPKAIHNDQFEYYSFLSEYFVQYDLGYRMYFDNKQNDLTGAYFRPSFGVLTRYSRSVTYNISQNTGYESTRLEGKEFLGLQLGYKSKITNTFYVNSSLGTLISYFKSTPKSVILFSPHLNISVGARF